jgi:Secretion system C-terminal sorting domain
MKRLLIMLLGLFWVLSLKSQTLSPQVVATSGTSYSSPAGQMDFTIGEVIIASMISGSNVLTQGIHQPEINFTSIEAIDNEFAFSLYPNPTDQFVTIESSKEMEMRVSIYDAIGQAIVVSDLFTKKITLDLQVLASGYYLLVITNASGKRLFTYKMNITI